MEPTIQALKRGLKGGRQSPVIQRYACTHTNTMELYLESVRGLLIPDGKLGRILRSPTATPSASVKGSVGPSES